MKQQQLIAAAQHLGISEGDAHSTRSANGVRLDRDAEAKLLAIEQIQLIKAVEQGGRRDEAWQKRGQGCSERISALDASGLKIVIADLLASKELTDEAKAEAALWLLGRNLAAKDPRGALAYATEHVSALSHSRNGIENVIYNSLGNWATDDPPAAVEWIKKNAAEFPDAMRAQSLHNVFHSAAGKEPRLAFTLIAPLGLNYSDTHSALHTIVTAAATDEQRNVTLAALREYRDARKSEEEISQAVDQMFGYFSWGFKEEGFTAATQWITGANLSSKELDRFFGELSRGYDGHEHAQWIGWIGENLPPGQGDGAIMDLMSRWTERDYEAAGKWLASAPGGPAKNAAIRSYAQTIFPRDRETAMQWLMTVPPGEGRRNSLQNILGNCLRDDPEAAAAFAKEHGLKP